MNGHFALEVDLVVLALRCPRRSPVDWYPLFPNPVVAESLLDRLINNSHQILMNGASYRVHSRVGRGVTWLRVWGAMEGYSGARS